MTDLLTDRLDDFSLVLDNLVGEPTIHRARLVVFGQIEIEFERSKAHVDDINLLVVNEFGKEISWTGMDINVVDL